MPGCRGTRASYDLVVTMEDATSAHLLERSWWIRRARRRACAGVRDVVAQHGLFCSLYTDRGSHYFFTPEGGRAGIEDGSDAVRPCPEAARHRAHRGLLAAGAGPFGACVLDAAGPSAERVEAGRDRHGRGGQPLAQRELHGGAQQAVRDRCRAGGFGIRGRSDGRVARDPVRSGGHGRWATTTP